MVYTYITVDMKTELVNLLKADLAAQGQGKVRVIRADPAGPAEVPCVAINRISDDETEQSISDEHGSEYDEATQVYTEFRGTFFSEALEIRVWHTNADQRDLLYLLVKAILFANRLPLIEKGLLNMSLRAGRDEQDATMERAPTPLYWSTITLTCLNPLNVEITETVEPISAITDLGGIVFETGEIDNGEGEG